jgi:hypothetical protein
MLELIKKKVFVTVGQSMSGPVCAVHPAIFGRAAATVAGAQGGLPVG